MKIIDYNATSVCPKCNGTLRARDYITGRPIYSFAVGYVAEVFRLFPLVDPQTVLFLECLECGEIRRNKFSFRHYKFF